MADIELDITSGYPCKGGSGAYRAIVYYASEYETHWKRLQLGEYDPRLESPTAVISEVRDIMKTELALDEPLPIENLVAVGVTRACMRRRHVRRHDDPPKERAAQKYAELGERVASYALARSLREISEIQPLSRDTRRVSTNGIGGARLLDVPGSVALDRVVHLPTTATERKQQPVRSVIRAYPRLRSAIHQPYVALHSEPAGYIEQILTPDQLQ